jgi:hypothetical protein
MKNTKVIYIFICLILLMGTIACGEAKDQTKTVPKEIAEEDFTITQVNGQQQISLDAPFKDFVTDETEMQTEDNYVGETYSGDTAYKTYMHQYENFNLYISNTYYNTKNRNFDDYYITQIDVTAPAYQTTRGIKIGDNRDAVLLAYGNETKDSQSNEDDSTLETTSEENSLFYQKNDKVLSIHFDVQNKVSGITLWIYVK